jgi:hypothetical protein
VRSRHAAQSDVGIDTFGTHWRAKPGPALTPIAAASVPTAQIPSAAHTPSFFTSIIVAGEVGMRNYCRSVSCVFCIVCAVLTRITDHLINRIDELTPGPVADQLANASTPTEHQDGSGDTLRYNRHRSRRQNSCHVTVIWQQCGDVSL